MKRWTRLCLIILALFLLITIISIVSVISISSKHDKEYLVEINRIVTLFDNESKTFDGKSLVLDTVTNENYDSDYIASMYYYCGENEEKINEMVNGSIVTNENYTVRKIDDTYVLFTYDVNDSIYVSKLITSITIYTVFAISFLAAVYFYVKNGILKPFNQLQEMPIELAKGNFDLNIKDSKNKHFGKFIWGLNMLNDNMRLNRKKEYELEKEKKMMILTISHDIKTPLSAINLYATAMEEDESRAKELTGKIKKNIELINSFVGDIVKYSSEDIINIEILNGEFYLQDLIRKVKVQYKEKMELMQAKLEIVDCPNPLLYGDKDRLYEAIVNILENALKYGDRRIIRMNFSSEDNCEIITISNSGSDIPNNEINHVFESFWRGKNAIGKEGNGLGLYIAREILRKMDGEIFISKEDDLLSFNIVVKRA